MHEVYKLEHQRIDAIMQTTQDQISAAMISTADNMHDGSDVDFLMWQENLIKKDYVQS